jgi:hypothetical protein
MNTEKNSFPQYRKLTNEKSFFKILNTSSFQEVQLIGKKKIFHTVEAKQYPEILRIQDMLQLHEEFYKASSKEEWDLIYSEVKNE